MSAFRLIFSVDTNSLCYDGQVFHALTKEDAHRSEIARALRRAADQLEAGYESGTCLDINGNTIGEWSC